MSPVLDWPDPSEITSRLAHDCIIIDGGLKCWSDQPDDETPTELELLLLQREDLDPGPPLPDIDFGPDATVIGISVADAASRCVAVAKKGAKCWGRNDFFNMGVPDDEQLLGDEQEERGAGLPYVQLGQNQGAAGIAQAGAGHCVLFSDGRVKCWGYGSAALGFGDTETRGDDLDEMGDALPFVDLGTDVHAVGLAGDGGHVCIWTAEGRVKCWGDNARGELGILSDDAPVGIGSIEPVGDDPYEMGDALPFVDLGEDVRVVQVSIGHEHSCVLTDDGRIKCWGANSTIMPPNPPYPPSDPLPDGRLGLGDADDRGAPLGESLPYVDLGTDVRAVAISTCYEHTCAVIEDGRMKCWGDNGGRQTENIGDDPGDMGDDLPFVDLGTDRTVRALGCNCALLDDDSIKCWDGLGYDAATMGDALEPLLVREDLYDPV